MKETVINYLKDFIIYSAISIAISLIAFNEIKYSFVGGYVVGSIVFGEIFSYYRNKKASAK